MKKLLVVAAAIILVLGGGLLLMAAFPEAVMAFLLRPGDSFDLAKAPPAPDYADARYWAALPDRKDHADWLPEGTPVVDRQATASADAFFIHPTTYYGSEHWNPPFDDPGANEMTAVTIASQASAFNQCCRVYAPKYRQGTIGVFMGADDNGLAALRIAYTDVRAAFRFYLAHHNQGRPFIIASHSQGTLHALRLLEEIDRGPERERLVAAYMVGYRPSLEALRERLPTIKPCAAPTDNGCLVGWDTHAEDGDQSYEADVYHWAGDELVPSIGVDRLCTNPVSWSLDGALVPAEQHRGGVSIRTTEPFPGLFALLFGDRPLGIEITGLHAPRVGQNTAHCVNGRLLVPHQPPPYEPMDPSGSYHLFDYDFFYMDVRHNAVARVEAFLAARAVALTAQRTPPAPPVAPVPD